MQENKGGFRYTYTALTPEEKKEIEGIRRNYAPSETTAETSLERLRRLHAKTKNPPTALSLTLGVVGTLVFGTGLCMVLEWNLPLWGVIVGALGALVAGLAYPAYRWLLKRNKKKYAAEILELSDELLKKE